MIRHIGPSAVNLFSQITSPDNLFLSWREFRKGKRNKYDIQQFEVSLENNLFVLSKKLSSKTYRHSNYTSFFITDPKLRHIHKASVSDRVVHHAAYRILYPLFDKSFIYDSYSCRIDKGTHRAVKRLNNFARQVSSNYSKPCFALKCDIQKFFDSVDHHILIDLIKEKIQDKDCLWLIVEIVNSFNKNTRGIPIGNLTSQLFANVYLNELDQFVKQSLGEKYYLRYCDDFIILGQDTVRLFDWIRLIEQFLKEKLKLTLHPNKIIIRKLRQGIDFLGYVILPYHKVLRTKTRKRMFKKANLQNLSSYLGLLQHCKGHQLSVNLVKKVQVR